MWYFVQWSNKCMTIDLLRVSGLVGTVEEDFEKHSMSFMYVEIISERYRLLFQQFRILKYKFSFVLCSATP